jgi:hypothetical protein
MMIIIFSTLTLTLKVEAVLSARLRVQLFFNMFLDADTNRLVVNGTHVDLKYIEGEKLIREFTVYFSISSPILRRLFLSILVASFPKKGIDLLLLLLLGIQLRLGVRLTPNLNPYPNPNRNSNPYPKP